MKKNNEYFPKKLNKDPQKIKEGEFSSLKNKKVIYGAAAESQLEAFERDMVELKKQQGKNVSAAAAEIKSENKKNEKIEQKVEKDNNQEMTRDVKNEKNLSASRAEETETDLSEKKERGGFWTSLFKESALKLSGLKAISAWRDYKKEKRENVSKKEEIDEEIKNREELENSAQKTLEKLYQKYYTDDYGGEKRLYMYTNISRAFKKKNPDLNLNDERKFWNEKIKRVEEKLKLRAERRRRAKEEAIERFNQLGREEKKKKIEALAETTYAIGLQTSIWTAGTVAFVGVMAKLSAPALKSLANAQIDGKLNLAGVKEGILNTFKSLNPRSEIDRETRIAYLTGTARTAFSTWAATVGINNYFGDGELSGENFKSGLSRLKDFWEANNEIAELVEGEKKTSWFDRIKTFFAGEADNNILEERNETTQPAVAKAEVPEWKNISDEIAKTDIDALVEKSEFNYEGMADFSQMETEDLVENNKVQIVRQEIAVAKGEGAVATFQELKKALTEQYADLPKNERPALVDNILTMSATELAEKYGFYNPGAEKESALLHLGDKFVISENGLEYVKDSGEVILLESGDDLIVPDKTFTEAGGQMFDADQKGIEVETNKTSTEIQNEQLPEKNISATEIENNLSKSFAEQAPATAVEEFLKHKSDVNLGAVVDYVKDLVREGKISLQSAEQASEVFIQSLSPENQALISQGQGSIQMSLAETVAVVNKLFLQEPITQADLTKYVGSKFDSSEVFYKKLFETYLENPKQALNKETVLSKLFLEKENFSQSNIEIIPEAAENKSVIPERATSASPENIQTDAQESLNSEKFEPIKPVYQYEGYKILRVPSTGDYVITGKPAFDDMFMEIGMTRREIEDMLSGASNEFNKSKKYQEFYDVFQKYLFTEEEGGLEGAKKFIHKIVEDRRMENSIDGLPELNDI